MVNKNWRYYRKPIDWR